MDPSTRACDNAVGVAVTAQVEAARRIRSAKPMTTIHAIRPDELGRFRALIIAVAKIVWRSGFASADLGDVDVGHRRSTCEEPPCTTAWTTSTGFRFLRSDGAYGEQATFVHCSGLPFPCARLPPPSVAPGTDSMPRLALSFAMFLVRIVVVDWLLIPS